jgi:hypothetical protein
VGARTACIAVWRREVTARGVVIVRVAVRVSVGSLCRHALGGATSRSPRPWRSPPTASRWRPSPTPPSTPTPRAAGCAYSTTGLAGAGPRRRHRVGCVNCDTACELRVRMSLGYRPPALITASEAALRAAQTRLLDPALLPVRQHTVQQPDSTESREDLWPRSCEHESTYS